MNVLKKMLVFSHLTISGTSPLPNSRKYYSWVRTQSQYLDTMLSHFLKKYYICIFSKYIVSKLHKNHWYTYRMWELKLCLSKTHLSVFMCVCRFVDVYKRFNHRMLSEGTFVLATITHIMNISAVTDSILIKLF